MADNIEWRAEAWRARVDVGLYALVQLNPGTSATWQVYDFDLPVTEFCVANGESPDEEAAKVAAAVALVRWQATKVALKAMAAAKGPVQS